MKRNIRIYDNPVDFVVIETEKSKAEIENFCKVYCYQIENDCYTITPDAIGKLLFDTEISSGDAPEYVESYCLGDYWEV